MLSHFVSDMRDVYKIFVMSIECSNLDLRVWILKFFRGQSQAKDLQEGCMTYKAAPIESKNRNYMQSLHCSVNIGSVDIQGQFRTKAS